MFFRRSNRVYPLNLRNSEEEYNEECPICLSKTLENDMILPCGHKYHFTCIMDWLDKKMTCPTCRMPLIYSMRLPENEK